MKKYGLILFTFLFTMPAFAVAAEEGQTTFSCVEKLSSFDWRTHLEEIEQQLKQTQASKIKSMIPMHDHLEAQGKEKAGSHPVFLIEFEDGLKAVWKPETKPGASVGEMIAYKAARMIGLHNVPPTVMTEIKGEAGVLSYYVHSSIDIKSARAEKRKEIFSKISAKEISDMHVFHFLFGNNDRHYGNILVDDQYRITLIDNESIKMLTQFNLGGIHYARRATLKPEFRTKEDELNETPFPYDRVRFLNMKNETIVEGFLRNTDANIDALKMQAKDRPNGLLPMILWRNIFWTPTRCNYLPDFDFKTLSAATVRHIQGLTKAKLREVFNEKYFSNLHIQLIMQRRAQILEAAKTATLID